MEAEARASEGGDDEAVRQLCQDLQQEQESHRDHNVQAFGSFWIQFQCCCGTFGYMHKKSLQNNRAADA